MSLLYELLLRLLLNRKERVTWKEAENEAVEVA